MERLSINFFFKWKFHRGKYFVFSNVIDCGFMFDENKKENFSYLTI